MRKASMLDIREIGIWYDITEDGMVYSKIKGRWLRPQVNSSGYVHYCISRGVDKSTWVFAHTLVALKYIGAPPTDRHEIDHLDENKQNNHYSNLVWRTHSENIMESYRRGRRGAWYGRDKAPHSLQTRLLMSNAKKKPVVYKKNGEEVMFDSIGAAADSLGVYPKKIYRCMKNSVPYEEGIFEFISEPPLA